MYRYLNWCQCGPLRSDSPVGSSVTALLFSAFSYPGLTGYQFGFSLGEGGGGLGGEGLDGPGCVVCLRVTGIVSYLKSLLSPDMFC